MKRVRALVAASAAMVTALAAWPAAAVHAGQGSGSPVLTASVTVLPADRVSDITITGTDYLIPPHRPGIAVFGGVYVFFGWVADPNHFGPSIRNSTSNDGTFGVSYGYPGAGGTDDTRDDGSGTVRLVSFTPGGESGTATSFHMDDNGNWTTTLRVYGSKFSSTDVRTGQTHTYDCAQLRCGIFTFGAHGKASATNEKFVPITFTAAGDAGAPAGAGATAQPSTQHRPAPTTTQSAAGVSNSSSSTATTAASTPSSVPASGADGERTSDGPAGSAADEVVAADVRAVRGTGGSGIPLLLAGSAIAVIVVIGVLLGRHRGRRSRRGAHRRRSPTVKNQEA